MAPGKRCCVAGCYSSSHTYKGAKRQHGLQFFRIPSVKRHFGKFMEELTTLRRKAWIAAIGRTNITFEHSGESARVCSRHFHRGKPAYEMMETDPDWVPSQHLGHTEIKETNSSRRERQSTKTAKKGDQGKKSKQTKQASSSIADSVQTRRQNEKCCVRSCNSPHFKRLDIKRTFFPFPTNDSRCKEWLKNCGQKDLMGKSSLQLRLKGYKVCSQHFEDSQFQTSAGVGGRKRLVPTAVPTIFRKNLYSRSSGPRRSRQEKSASCGGLLQMQLFSHWQPVPAGNVHHIPMDHQYARQMPEVEIDFAEDPTLHIKAPNTLADVAPQLPAHAETAGASQSFAAGVDIKEEPMDAESEFISAKMEPPDDYTERVHSKTEPQFNTRTAPHFDFKTEHEKFKTEPLEIKTEPQDFIRESLDVGPELGEMKTEPQDFVRESPDVGPELGEIKSEPVYFEELLTNSEPVDNVAHTTDFRVVLADSECGDHGDFKVEVDDTQSDTESAQSDMETEYKICKEPDF